jgi:hypothetical protein
MIPTQMKDSIIKMTREQGFSPNSRIKLLAIYVETSSYSWVVRATNDDSIGLMST